MSGAWVDSRASKDELVIRRGAVDDHPRTLADAVALAAPNEPFSAGP